MEVRDVPRTQDLSKPLIQALVIADDSFLDQGHEHSRCQSWRGGGVFSLHHRLSGHPMHVGPSPGTGMVEIVQKSGGIREDWSFQARMDKRTQVLWAKETQRSNLQP